MFRGVAALPGVRLISLHKGEGEAQLAGRAMACASKRWARIDGAGGAFMDTAAVMTLCDLVITLDTSVAHVAGALGVPVWVALKHMADWRWLLRRDDTPWYPTMRLFRQDSPNDWPSALAGSKPRWPRWWPNGRSPDRCRAGRPPPRFFRDLGEV